MPHLLPVDIGNRTPGEMRQKLVAEIAPVDVERPGLPDPLVTPERCLGDRLEQRLSGCRGRFLAAPDGGEHFGCRSPRVQDTDGTDVADDLPDALVSVLAVDEEAPAAGRQHPDAEALQLGVTNIVGGFSGLESGYAGVGEVGPGHFVLPVAVATEGTAVADSVPRLQNSGEKNDPISNS